MAEPTITTLASTTTKKPMSIAFLVSELTKAGVAASINVRPDTDTAAAEMIRVRVGKKP
jgi:hypothetical protein